MRGETVAEVETVLESVIEACQELPNREDSGLTMPEETPPAKMLLSRYILSIIGGSLLLGTSALAGFLMLRN